MARNLLDADPPNYLHRGSSIISNGDPRPISIGLWLKAHSRRRHCLFSNGYPDGSPRLFFKIENFGAIDLQGLYSGAWAGDSDPFVLSTTDWTHHGVDWSTSGDAVRYWLNGAANGTSSRATSSDTTDGAAIGTLNGSAAWDIDGWVAEFAVWNAILTADEWSALGNRLSPLLIRPASLAAYVPLLGAHSPEIDLIGGPTWTINATCAVVEHPAIFGPADEETRHVVPGSWVETIRHGNITTVIVHSKLTPPVYFYWYVDGRYVGQTSSPSRSFYLAAGDQAQIDVIDSTDPDLDPIANAPAAYPVRRTLWWIRSIDAGRVDRYRIEQQKDGGAWTEIGSVHAVDGQWDYTFLTDRLDDLGAYAWRVVPIDAAGNDGDAITLAAETVVRKPDGVDFTATFDDGTDRVTLDEA